MSSKFKSWLRGNRKEDGQAMVMVALTLVVLLGFGAFAVDLGNVAVQKSDLQNAADAAALAGAADLPNLTAENTAKTYLNKNGMNVTAENVLNDGELYTTNILDGGTRLEVICTRQVDYYFAGVLGFESTEVKAVAVAQKSGITTGVSGLRPWALVNKYEVIGGTKKNPTSTWVDYTYTYGLEFKLKAGGGGGSNGYYGIVGFGSQNANSAQIYKDNIKDGYNGLVSIGDTVVAGSGNDNVKNVIDALMVKSGDTLGDYTKATKGSSRIVIIPKIDAQTFKVIGFSAIYLKSVDNQGFITANFLYDTTWPEVQQDPYEDWGLRSGTKLVE